MPATDDALHIYTDGSYLFDRERWSDFKHFTKTARAAYGWVLANGDARHLSARIVEHLGEAIMATPATRGNVSTHMESAAVIDALCEFGHEARPLVIHTDCLSLSNMIELYRAGDIDGSSFLTSPRILTEADGRRLLTVLDSVDFTIVWVKGHSYDFHNCVIDQALRHSTNDGLSEEFATAFARRAIETGQATIWTARRRWALRFATDSFDLAA